MQDRAVGQLLGHTRFTSPEDTLILEDESARMPLTGTALDPGCFVTGVVLAVRGTATPGTEGFHVQASQCKPDLRRSSGDMLSSLHRLLR